MEMTTAAKQV
jgi:hypothetical protein